MELEKYMRRCFQLAESGLGSVSPNPLVGSVIVLDGQIIGEGFHRQYGEAHAEVHAIRSVADPALLRRSTLFVNLEPCSHHGKTPPCADLIITSGIPRVVICNTDPYEEVAGSGIARLRDAGIEVTQGILEEEGRLLNRRFFTYIEKKRPYIILKWAKSRDAFMDIDRGNGQLGSHQITGIQSQRLVHTWRAAEDAILVGLNTVRNDDPALTTRLVSGKNPTRVVIDPRGELHTGYRIFNDDAKLILISDQQNEASATPHPSRVFTDLTIDPVTSILQVLYEARIQSLIVEGGRFTLSQFLSAEMWDEIRLFTGKEPILFGMPSPTITMNPASTHTVGDDILDIYYNAL